MFPEAKAKTVEVLLRSNVSGASGELRLEAPQGWRVQPGSAAFQIAARDEETALSFTLTPPAGAGERRIARRGQSRRTRDLQRHARDRL